MAYIQQVWVLLPLQMVPSMYRLTCHYQDRLSRCRRVLLQHQKGLSAQQSGLDLHQQLEGCCRDRSSPQKHQIQQYHAWFDRLMALSEKRLNPWFLPHRYFLLDQSRCHSRRRSHPRHAIPLVRGVITEISGINKR